MMILYPTWGMALRNESHKFDFSDNSTNVVSIHNLIRFPIDIFYDHLTLFLNILTLTSYIPQGDATYHFI